MKTMKTVICPGSFDPVTNGHLDIIRRSSKLFDKVIVVVMINYHKPEGYFTVDERVELLKRSLTDVDNIEVETYGGLLAEYAKEKGAKTVSITNNPDTALGNAADISICADTGPEVITGSTRMKAGTSQKIILNMISTTAMIKCGYVYENMMINLKPSNIKLQKRVIHIVSQITGYDEKSSIALLEKGNWVIRDALRIWKLEDK